MCVVFLSLGENTDYHHLSAATKDCGDAGGDVGRGNTHCVSVCVCVDEQNINSFIDDTQSSFW